MYEDEDTRPQTHGTIFHPDPSKTLQLDLWCDADFASLHKVESNEDSTSMITLGGQPVVWSSKLQTEITLSMAEAEYAAHCLGMRSLLPLHHILFEIADCFDIPINQVSTISHIWEDNQACITVAAADPPRLTACNKHRNVKHHRFCSKLGNRIKIRHVP